MLRLRVAIASARVARLASRLAGRGATALPGLVALKVDPRLIERLAGSLPGGVVVVTGTNGKTTTTKMIVAMLEGAGRRVLTNRTGSNLARGVATTLIAASSRGRVDADLAVFEADEAAVRDLGPRLSPALIVVTNLARDQLDRYGELETTARHVAVAVQASASAVLNGDDPLVASLATDRVSRFGAVAEIRAAMPSDRALYGDDEGTPAATPPDALLRSAVPDGDGQVVTVVVDGREVVVRLQVPGVYNAYNATGALLAVARLGLDPEAAATDLAAMAPAFGRGQVLEYQGRRVTLILVKNPAGLNQAIRLLCHAPDAAPVLLAINDHHADGRDVSWLWDAALEELAATPHRFGAGGVRAADMALRLKYAGVEAWAEPDDAAALARVVADAPEGGVVYLVPTYTAMLSYLALLRPGVSPEEAWS